MKSINGFVTLPVDSVIELTERFEVFSAKRYNGRKERFMQRAMNKPSWKLFGIFTINPKQLTQEQAEHLWFNGDGDAWYSPHDRATAEGAIAKYALREVKRAAITARNLGQTQILVSTDVAACFSKESLTLKKELLTS